MSLLGKAAMVAWHNLMPGQEVGHDRWHSREHLFERVGIPGFRRGRRCVAPEGSAGECYFLMYEVDELSVLTSKVYLDRLNNPTPWSQRVIPTICDMTRTLCRVRASSGGGVGGWVSTLRFSVTEKDRERLIKSLSESVAPDLASEEAVTAAHLLEGDGASSGLNTEEKRLRGVSDSVADLVLIVEGYEREAVRSTLSPESMGELFGEKGAAGAMIQGVYQTRHVVSEADLTDW